MQDIEKRWNKLYAEGESRVTGREKLFEVRTYENDISFLQNYLTQDLADEMELFSYGWACEHGPQEPKKCGKCGEVVMVSRKVEDVVKNLVLQRVNYGVPRIVVARVQDDGQLVLAHERGDLTTLDPQYVEATLKYLVELWKKPVILNMYDNAGGALQYRVTSTGAFEAKKGA